MKSIFHSRVPCRAGGRFGYRGLLCLLVAIFTAASVLAVITAELPLQRINKESQYIVAVKIEKLYADKPAMVLAPEQDLKGKLPYRKLPVLLKGDSEAEKLKHVPQLLKRLADDLPLVLFIEEKGKKLTALAYTNGTWMQFVGDKTGDDSAVLSLTHGEPYLSRTYHGPTSELKKLVEDALAGKKAWPKVDGKQPPGFGPEIK